jgi:hypothetical protein
MSVGRDGRPLTAREMKAIRDLQKLADRWPESLTLFSWSGSLVVFKTDEWSVRNVLGPLDDANDYVVENIYGIPNDGGDP